MTRAAAVYMPKGGVGKSFLSGHLATGLSLVGRKVLLIDADPGQGQLSLRLGGVERRGDLLRLFREGASDQLLQQDPQYPNLWAVTADPKDVTQFKPIIASYGPFWPLMLKESRMRSWLDGRFDYVIFDCGPGFESEVTTCVLQAASEMWLPYAVEYESFDSYQNLINHLLPQARKDPAQFITHVIPNKLSLGRERGVSAEEPSRLNEHERRRAELVRRARTNDGVALLEMLKTNFGRRMTSPVRLSEAVGQRTAGEGKMIWEFDPESEIATDLTYVVEAIVEGEGVLAGGAA
jgi:cellulose biosynthesis protein BcsQ